jgi:hypothetical protein
MACTRIVYIPPALSSAARGHNLRAFLGVNGITQASKSSASKSKLKVTSLKILQQLRGQKELPSPPLQSLQVATSTSAAVQNVPAATLSLPFTVSSNKEGGLNMAAEHTVLRGAQSYEVGAAVDAAWNSKVRCNALMWLVGTAVNDDQSGAASAAASSSTADGQSTPAAVTATAATVRTADGGNVATASDTSSSGTEPARKKCRRTLPTVTEAAAVVEPAVAATSAAALVPLPAPTGTRPKRTAAEASLRIRAEREAEYAAQGLFIRQLELDSRNAYAAPAAARTAAAAPEKSSTKAQRAAGKGKAAAAVQPALTVAASTAAAVVQPALATPAAVAVAAAEVEWDGYIFENHEWHLWRDTPQHRYPVEPKTAAVATATAATASNSAAATATAVSASSSATAAATATAGADTAADAAAPSAADASGTKDA